MTKHLSWIVLGLSFFIVARNFALLPDVIPTRFDSTGVPIAWSGRSVVFVPSLIVLFLLLLIKFNEIRVARSQLPETIKALRERFLRLLMPLLALLSFVTSLEVVKVSLDKEVKMEVWPILLVSALLWFTLVWYGFRLWKMSRRPISP